jgi:hypothetical protein
VHARHDDDGLSDHTIIERVRESLEEHAPGFSVDDREASGVSNDSVLGRLDRSKRLPTKSGALALVPEVCVVDIRGGSW